ncbi:MAG: DUF2085 domain-containing protein [Chloroflexi bacterium]|nr:MAG: DUF2085 domain-containing protein [Chloroflexota bacterium]
MALEPQATPAPAVNTSRSFPDRAVLFVARHWLLLVNLAVFIFIGLPILAPFLAEAGLERPAYWIYSAYRITCHQLPYRSYFIGGPAFTHSVAEIEAVTGVNDKFALIHRPLVNSVFGSQTAVCHRDIAIYGAVLVAGLVFGLVRDRLKPLPFKFFLLFVIPIAVDGFTQLLGGLVPFLPARESTWFLRTVTGALFGIGGVWLAYPYIEQGMREIRQSLEKASQDSDLVLT